MPLRSVNPGNFRQVPIVTLTFSAGVTLLVVIGVITVLACTRASTDVVLLAAVSLLMLCGVISVEQALVGFSNEGVITVGVLYVVVAGLRDTGAAARVMHSVLGRPRGLVGAQLRIMLPIAAASSLMNNTPLVAAAVPVVNEWARNHGLPVSRLMMPLSFAAILGGLMTIIGTSTNLVAAGLARDAVEAGTLDRAPGFFTLTPIGLVCALVGIAYMVLASRWLLPQRTTSLRAPDELRSYTVEMVVEGDGAIAQRTVEEAGLRHLDGLFLAEVERNNTIIAAVPPTFRLQEHDRLIFVGAVDSVAALQRLRGLRPGDNDIFKLDTPRAERVLIEAVVSPRCPLIGLTIRDGNFRARYHAVIIAVGRGGQRIPGKIGDIELRIGDQLLLETRRGFVSDFQHSQDFYLISEIPGSQIPRHDRAATALLILAAMVALGSAFEYVESFSARGLGMLHAALIAAMMMLATRCCSVESARNTVDWSVIVTIAAAVGIGGALMSTGLASAGAGYLVSLGGHHPHATLAMLYLSTMVLTELLSNSAAVVLSFPGAIAVGQALGIDPLPFIIAVTIAASCGFATPIGYQTNLIVYGPGGYRFSDYLRFGGPLNVIVGVTTVALVPEIYPFGP